MLRHGVKQAKLLGRELIDPPLDRLPNVRIGPIASSWRPAVNFRSTPRITLDVYTQATTTGKRAAHPEIIRNYPVRQPLLWV
ncbi:MAG: hypothetical protein WAK26_21305 [Terracidiphilus sp.]